MKRSDNSISIQTSIHVISNDKKEKKKREDTQERKIGNAIFVNDVMISIQPLDQKGCGFLLHNINDSSSLSYF